MAQGPSVTGSKGLALGMCWVSLQGLEGNGDRVPEACGGMWGRKKKKKMMKKKKNKKRK